MAVQEQISPGEYMLEGISMVTPVDVHSDGVEVGTGTGVDVGTPGGLVGVGV